MNHIVSLSPQLEEIYAQSAFFLGISVDEVLNSVLVEYVENLIKQKKKALN